MSSILHLIDTGGPGGAETVFLELASRLNLNAHRNIAVVGRDGWLADQVRQRGLQPFILHARGSLNLKYLKQLIETIRQHDVKLIVAHLFGAAIYGGLAGMATRKPVISILHGQSDVGADERLEGIKRWVVARGSARIVFVSDALRDTLQPLLKLPPNRCTVIENGIDMERYVNPPAANLRSVLGLAPSTLLIGAIGNVRRAKDYETLLNAAQTVCRDYPQVHFVIAGDTSGEAFPGLKRLHDELQLTPRVHFLGLRNDVPAILADLDIFVLSSRTEGFSLALVEAMASGRAVVATRSGGPEAIVEPERTGLLVPTKDPAALAAALSKILQDATLKQRLERSAQSVISNRFSIERMLKDYGLLAQTILDT